jgi:hypothetical protein
MSPHWKTTAIAPAPPGITVMTHHVAGGRDTYTEDVDGISRVEVPA